MTADKQSPKLLLPDDEAYTGRPTLRAPQGHRYLPGRPLLAAARTAMALGRALLLTGEPGVGKTDFAYAAARMLATKQGRAAELPLSIHVRSDLRSRDTLYRYDGMSRFVDAQLGGEERERARLPQNYVSLAELGRALVAQQRHVVLIDEIDKAPRDFPNDLLRELDEGRFRIEEITERDERLAAAKPDRVEPAHRALRREMSTSGARLMPLVLITSNDERSLPDAFLRRVIYHHVEFPSDEMLEQIIDLTFNQPGTPAVVAGPEARRIVRAFSAVRGMGLEKKPATAELLDWVEALTGEYTAGKATALAAFALSRSDEARDLLASSLSCLVKTHADLVRVRDRLTELALQAG